MSKLLIATAAILATLGFSMDNANAGVGTPLWTCSMKANLLNKSGAFIIGVVDKRGPAIVKCVTINRNLEKVSVTQKAYVEILGPAVGIDLNFVDKQTIAMATGQVGVRSVESFYGKHRLSLSADANLLALEGGVAVGVAFGDRIAELNGSAEISETPGLAATLSIQNMNIYHSKAEYLEAKARRNN